MRSMRLTSNEFVMGDHHLSLQVLAELAADEAESARHARRLKRAERSRRARAQSAGRHRHDGGARGPGARGGLLGAAAGKFPDAAAQGADHLAQLCRHGAVSQLSGRPRARQSLGRGAGAARDQRPLALLLLAARQRSGTIRTAAAARTPATPSSAVRPARARRCSSAFWWPCWSAGAPRR